MALERFGERAEGRAFDRRVARRLLAFLRPFWAHMAAALLLMLVSSLLSLAVPYLVKTAIDVNMAQGDLAGLGRTALVIAATFIGTYLVSAGQRWLLSWVGLRVLTNLRRALFGQRRRLQAFQRRQEVARARIAFGGPAGKRFAQDFPQRLRDVGRPFGR